MVEELPHQSAGSAAAADSIPGDEALSTRASQADRPRLAFNTVKLASARGVSMALNLVAWTLIARDLGPVGYGIVQFFVAIFFYVGFVSDFGMTTFATRRFSLRPDPRFIGDLLGARVLIASTAVGLSLLAAITLPMSSTERWIAGLLASSVFAAALNLTWVLRGQERASALSIVDVGGSLTLLVGALLFVNSPEDVVPAAGAAAAVQWAMAAVSIAVVGPSAEMIPRLAVRNLRYVKKALPLGIAVLAIGVYYHVDHILLGLLRTPGELGLYAAAYRLVYPLLGISGVVGTLALPRLARLSASSGPALDRVIELMSTALLLFALPIAVGTTLVSDQLVELIFGGAYAGSADALRLLIWSTVTVFANAPFGFLLLARHQDTQYMWITVAGAIVNVLANVALIPVIGFIGAAIATIVAEVLVLLLILAGTRDLAARALSVAIPAAAVPTVVMALAVWPLRDQFLAVPVGIVVYGAVVLALRPAPVRALIVQFRGQQ